jgi:hypothetical protein
VSGEVEQVPRITERVRSMFETPVDAIARQRSELRVRPELFVKDTSTYHEAGRFDECEAAHGEVVTKYNVAKAELFEAIGLAPAEATALTSAEATEVPPATEAVTETLDTPATSETAAPIAQETVIHTSWHQPRPVEGDTPTPNKLYEVTVRVQDGELHNVGGHDPITVKSYTVVKPEAGIPSGARELTGALTGSVVFEGDATVSTLSTEDVAAVKPLDTMATKIQERLRRAGQDHATKPWRDALVSQPRVPWDVSGEAIGIPSSSPLGDVLLGIPPRDMAAAKVTLSNLCEKGIADVPGMLDYPMDKLLPVLETSPPLAERYGWFLGNVADINGAYVTGGRDAVILGFAEEFLDELPTEEARAERLRTLAHILGGMENVTHSAPELLPAAEPTPPNDAQ